MKHHPAVPPWSGWMKPCPSQWSVYGKAIRRPSLAASKSATSQPGSTRQSLFSTTTIGAVDRRIPVFQPTDTPRFWS